MNQAQYYCRTIKRLCNCGVNVQLPEEYQLVKYLENTGEEYITTPFKPYTTVKTEFRFSLSDTPDYTQMMLFGVRGRESVWGTCYWIQLSSSTQCRIGTATDYSSYNITLLSGENTLSFASGDIKLNGSVISNNTTTYDRDYGNRVINLWNRPSYNKSSLLDNAIASAGLRIHEVTFTNNDELVAHLYPCYRKSDNEPGMYDIVTETFFTNAGTGAFTLGNNL